MFSEYASRFLAQSQSRISFRQQPEESSRAQLDRTRRQDQISAQFTNGGRRSHRPAAGRGIAQFPQFPFTARLGATQAPLFHSTTDELRDEEDEAEHERELADFYALQRSRRQFVPNRLGDSSEADDDEGSRGSGLRESGEALEGDDGRHGGDIRSSWTGGPGRRATRDRQPASQDSSNPTQQSNDADLSQSSGGDRMYDVGLESTTRSQLELEQDEPPHDLALEMAEDDPPSVQNFRKQPPRDPFSNFTAQETTGNARGTRPQPPPPPDSSDTESVPPTVGIVPTEPPRHDAFWGSLYIICLISLFASFALVYLHTALPKKFIGDTIYNALHRSYYLLGIDTMIAIIVSLVWLALLRSYVRPLVYLILVSVPVILFSFTLYPFISSFQKEEHTSNLQDTAMRWLAFIPGIMGGMWVFGVYKGRHAFGKAISTLEFASKILAANPELMLVGFATLASVIAWTWIWTAMFSRVFLGGRMLRGLFVVDVGTWWLGAFFVLVYLWTLGVQGGIQRATTAATVSQWYFHRFAQPAPTSRQVVQAALGHALTTLFGTVSLSALLALLVRVPVLIMPRRSIAFISLCCSFSLLPNTVMLLTHPTTLTYAAIHSQPLAVSARAVAQLSFMNSAGSGGSGASTDRFRPLRAGTDRHYRFDNAVRVSKTSSVPPHRIALLLLHATRLIAAFGFGFGAWVRTASAHSAAATTTATEVAASTMAAVAAATAAKTTTSTTGSLYAYVVGLIAGAIGWGVLGAMEGILTGIVDAVVVCWASEVRNGEVKYCREAGQLLGDGVEDAGFVEGEGLLGR